MTRLKIRTPEEGGGRGSGVTSNIFGFLYLLLNLCVVRLSAGRVSFFMTNRKEKTDLGTHTTDLAL